MHLFYTPDISGNAYTLNEEESKHCVKVLRLEEGSIVSLIDGKGGLYSARITQAHHKHTQLQIIDFKESYGRRNHYLHIAVAPTKNIERLEWFLEKSTELGIDEITPIICDRSERKEVKIDRLTKVITSAVKQSIKAFHPKLNEAIRLKTFLSNQINGQKFIAHCIGDKKTTLKEQIVLNGEYIILIGPEGDFTPAEVQQSINAGFVPISLGNSRLRTETAALEACFEVNFLNR
jgi:16S rRNA (uracil1498-N3)-methyltransferase